MVIDCVDTICLKATPHELPKLEHLDFAIKESRDMKMQPSLEHALRHKEILITCPCHRPLRNSGLSKEGFLAARTFSSSLNIFSLSRGNLPRTER